MESTTYAPPPQRFEAGTQMVVAGRRHGRRRVVPATSSAWTRSPRTRRTWPGCCSTRSRRCPGVRVIGPTDTARPAGDRLVRRRRRARARRRPGARRRRRRRAGGPPLRAAAAPPVRRRVDPRASAPPSTRPTRRSRSSGKHWRGSGRSSVWRCHEHGSMEQLYQQVILDHAKFPHGRGLGAAGDLHLHTGESHQVNPTCGDEVTLQVDLDGDGVVRDVRWDGQGCSISQASVSVLHDLVVGNDLATVDQHRRHVPRAHADARRRASTTTPRTTLGDATAFTGRRQVPRAHQVRAARLGGADRRTHQDRRTSTEELMSTDTTRTPRPRSPTSRRPCATSSTPSSASTSSTSA